MSNDELNYEFKREVLLSLIDGVRALLVDDFSEDAFGKATNLLRKILLDNRLYQPKEIPEHILTKPFKRRKVGRIYRAPHPLKGKYLRPVSFIRITGDWLAEYGFEVGGGFIIIPSPGQLVLKKFSYREQVSKNFEEKKKD